MAITKESKQAIRQQIEKLENQKNIAARELRQAEKKASSLKGRKDKIDAAIQNLKDDLGV